MDVLFLHHITLHQFYIKTHWVWDPHAGITHPMYLGI
jgi:hypothetical protein